MINETIQIILPMLLGMSAAIIMPIAVTIFIACIISKRRKQEKEMFDSALTFQKEKLKQEKEANLVHKMVTCPFCEQETEYGQGKCPYCGGKLKLPKAAT